MKNSFYNNFSGTIDDLLSHCEKIDPDKVEEMVENKSNDLLTPAECRATLMEELKISETEAEKIRMEIALEEIDKICKEFAGKGYLEIVGYDENFNPQYSATELGRKVLKWS